MADGTLQRINEAEKQARSMIDNAREEAAKIIEIAREETTETFKQLIESSKEHLEEKKRETEIGAVTLSMDYLRETEELSDVIQQELSARKEHAIEAVIQVIVS